MIMQEIKPIHCLKAKKKAIVKLYRYYSNIEYAIDAISTDQLYLPLSDSFNDPFDCKVVNNGEVLDANLSGDIDIVLPMVSNILLSCPEFFVPFLRQYNFEEMEKQFVKKLNGEKLISPQDVISFVHKYSAWEQPLDDFIELIKKSYIKQKPVVSISKRVACFSEVNDSILMWAYYANCHKGVCLEYTPYALDMTNPDYKSLFDGIGKVYYSQHQYNNSQMLYSPDNLDDIFFNKAQCWAHEQEWRLVLWDNIEKVSFPCLSGIYLGARFREATALSERNNIFARLLKSAFARERQVPIYEAKLKNDEYQLFFDEIVGKEDIDEI